MVDERLLESVVSAAKPRYPDMIKRDISTALSQFPDLNPSTEHFVYNDGRQSLVVTLNGTVPINYKGNTYNIPVCLYINETHPYTPPICYVRPTSDMVIKASPSIDTNGRLYLPYLHQWKYPKSDLTGLISVMIIAFNENCPVFARSSASSANLFSPPSPGSIAGSAPYPSYGYPMPQSAPSQSCPSVNTAGGYQPYRGVTPNQPTVPWYSYQSAGYTQPGAASSGYPSYGTPSSNQLAGAGQPLSSSASTTGTSNDVYGTIQPEHIRSSLLTAVQDKLRAKLRDKMGTAHAELQSIKKMREDLNAGEQRIKAVLAKMQQEEADLLTATTVFRDAKDEMQKFLNSASNSEELKIDDALDTTTPLYRQLLNSYVEDNAIEDCIYYLSQALKNGKLDLEIFLKNVRTLSRQQFYLRAIMIKCRRVGGLDYNR